MRLKINYYLLIKKVVKIYIFPNDRIFFAQTNNSLNITCNKSNICLTDCNYNKL